jgi:Ran-binding protein 1
MDLDKNDNNGGGSGSDDDNVEAEVNPSMGGEARFAAVSIASGEEQFNLLLKLKCQLMRFDDGENTWKRRGEGEIKILESKTNANSHTVLVRREVIGKIAAQHHIVAGMKLKPHPSSDRVFVWSTPSDFSDDEDGIPETFMVKFAESEQAQQFKSVFETLLAGKK